MVTRRRIVRKQPAEDVADEDELEEPDVDLEEDYGDEDEEEDAAPVKDKRQNGRISRRSEPEDDFEEEEEVVPAKPVKKPAVKQTVPAKAAKQPAAKPTARRAEPEEEFEEEEVKAKPIAVKKVADAQFDNLIGAVLQHLEEGKALTVANMGNGQYSVKLGDAVVAAPAAASGGQLRGYWREVLNPKWDEWTKEWGKKSFEEKVAFAKKAKLTWEAHDNPKIEVIHLTDAVRQHLDIPKYKPQYDTREKRDALKRKLRGIA